MGVERGWSVVISEDVENQRRERGQDETDEGVGSSGP